jgi:hypothetical protein
VVPDQDFCLDCGEPIAGVKPVAPAAPPPPAPPPTTAPPAAAAAKKPAWKRRVEEPEPVRCPGCGTKTLAARCPGCGTPLRRDDD